MHEHPNRTVSLRDLARMALYIGATGYGGPAIIAQMNTWFVRRKQWIGEREFLTGLSLCQVLPGATGVEMMTYLGYRMRGAMGGLIAAIAFTFPPAMLMIVLSAIYFRYGDVPLAHSVFKGLGAVVVGLIVNAVVSLGRSAIRDRRGLLIALAGFAAMQWLHVSLLLLVLLSAVAGYLLYPNRSPGLKSESPTDQPDIRTSRFWMALTALLVILGTLLLFTRHTLLSQLVLSITHVGLLAFGGGFVSIPLFHQEVIVKHQWMTARTFLDGIALGQITPGPVLITATFIGYHLLGVPGALAATIAIFTPGTLAMLVLADHQQRLSRLNWMDAVVRGIVAGFIGVLTTVAIRLGAQSLTDWKTVSIAVASTIILVVWKKDPLWVIIGGVVLSLLMFA